MKIIKIYGERNTGTTYLTKLINENINCSIVKSRPPFWLRKIQKLIPNNNEILRDLYFSIKKDNLGWKHALVNEKLLEPIEANRKDILFLFLIKNPYSWLLSMYRNPYHSQYKDKIRNYSFTEFFSMEWKCVRRENVSDITIQNPIMLWNVKNGAYLKMMKEKKYHTIIINYESILKNYIDVLEKVADIGNFKLKNKKGTNVLNSAKGDSQTFSDYHNYYLNEVWKEKLNSSHIQFINHYLDSDLMKEFEYKIINK